MSLAGRRARTRISTSPVPDPAKSGRVPKRPSSVRPPKRRRRRRGRAPAARPGRPAAAPARRRSDSSGGGPRLGRRVPRREEQVQAVGHCALPSGRAPVAPSSAPCSTTRPQPVDALASPCVRPWPGRTQAAVGADGGQPLVHQPDRDGWHRLRDAGSVSRGPPRAASRPAGQGRGRPTTTPTASRSATSLASRVDRRRRAGPGRSAASGVASTPVGVARRDPDPHRADVDAEPHPAVQGPGAPPGRSRGPARPLPTTADRGQRRRGSPSGVGAAALREVGLAAPAAAERGRRPTGPGRRPSGRGPGAGLVDRHHQATRPVRPASRQRDHARPAGIQPAPDVRAPACAGRRRRARRAPPTETTATPATSSAAAASAPAPASTTCARSRSSSFSAVAQRGRRSLAPGPAPGPPGAFSSSASRGHQHVLPGQEAERVHADQRLDPAHAGADRRLAEHLHQAELAGAGRRACRRTARARSRRPRPPGPRRRTSRRTAPSRRSGAPRPGW